jgi:RHS repeat-associated protein
MVARWLEDQIVDNAVTVTWPDTSEEFLLLPRADGSTTAAYNPPLGTATMLTSGSPDQYGRFTTFSYQRKDRVTLSFAPNPSASLQGISSITGWSYPNGMAVSVSYDATTGLVSSVSNSLGRSLSFTATSGRITAIADAAGRQVTFGYDGNGSLSTFVDALGAQTTFSYDASGTYDLAGHLTQVFYPSLLGSAFLTNWYDALGRVAQQADANGNKSTLFFASSRSELLDPVGNRHITYQTSRGKILKDFWVLDGGNQNVYFDTGQSNGHVNVTANQYDGQDRLVLSTAPEANTVAYTYSNDPKQNLVGVLVTPKPGSGQNPTTQSFTYDPTWNKVASATDALGLISTYGYDGGGNLIRLTADAGDQSHFNATQLFAYDGYGQLTAATDELGFVTRYSYNEFGDLTSIIAGLGGLNVTTTYAYDAVGNAVSRTDPNGNTTSMAYDAARRLLTTTAPPPYNAGSRLVQTSNAYDADGQLTSITRPNGPTNQITQFAYTKTGKLKTITDPNGNTTTYSYDVDDRTQSIAEPVSVNRMTSFTYDALSRLATVIDSTGAVSERYAYTPNGRQASFTDARGNLTTYQYDGFDRLTTATYAAGTALATSEHYGYDADGNVTSRLTRKGDTISYGYDTLNRLCTKSVAATVTPCTAQSSASPTVWYGYDRTGRITMVQDNSSSIPAVVAATSTQYVNSAKYDQLNRPVSFSWSPAPAAVATDPTTNVTFAHTYNAANQRIGQATTDPSWWYYPTAPPNTTTTYTANALNQYSTIGTTTPTYDANGNLTYDGTFTYAYDAENRMLSATGAATTATYAYDAQGRRKSKTVNGTTTLVVTDAENREVLEYSPGAGQILSWYAYGAGTTDVLNRMDLAGSTRQTFLSDIQGSIVATVASDTGAVAKRGYFPYGASGSATGSFAYTGLRLDPETNGLYYARARTYSPSIGRFLQPDPAGYLGGNNFYIYGANDPLNLTDPLGLAADSPEPTASAAGGGGLQPPNSIVAAAAAGGAGGNGDGGDGNGPRKGFIFWPPDGGGPTRSNGQLVQDIAQRADAWGDRQGLGIGPVAGIYKHGYAERLLNRYQQLYGDRGLTTEVRYVGGQLWRSFAPLEGSVRLDVVEGPLASPTAVYDYKFGSGRLSQFRIGQIRARAGLGSNVPVLEVRP